MKFIKSTKFALTSVLAFSIHFAKSDTPIYDVNSTFTEGENCEAKTFSGTCKLIEDCPRVNLEVSRGKNPEMVCGFNGMKPIICCPTEKSDGLSFFIVGNNVPKLTQDEVRRAFNIKYYPRDKANSKCKEYANTFCPSSRTRKKRAMVVVGGEQTPPKLYPHMAAVGYDDKKEGIKWLCGGTIISEKFVLTAAHCVFSFEWGAASWVRIGDLNLKRDDDNSYAKSIKVLKRIKHPNYKGPYLYHDIALLKLKETVEFNSWIRPACLAPIPRSKIPDYVDAMGWGLTEFMADEGSDDLLHVTLSWISQAECNEHYKDNDYKLYRGIVPYWQICAGQDGKDTCQGDSGGPLIVPSENYSCMNDVIGITSVGKMCGSGVPGVYTKVSYYVPWIESIVWPQ